MRPGPRLALAVQYASRHACPARPQVRRWVAAALALACPDRAARLVVRFVDSSEARALNRSFRQRDYPTNVLTFDYPGEVAICADIVLCMPVMAREARVQSKSIGQHTAHLIVHGVLHACGHDHEKARDAQRMEELERRVLERFRIPDPYA